MNPEEVKKILEGLHNQMVVVVRPFFGHQSDSWMGILTNNKEFQFHFRKATDDSTILFTVDDVVKVEKTTNTHTGMKAVIRLKGPHDYA